MGHLELSIPPSVTPPSLTLHIESPGAKPDILYHSYLFTHFVMTYYMLTTVVSYLIILYNKAIQKDRMTQMRHPLRSFYYPPQTAKRGKRTPGKSIQGISSLSSKDMVLIIHRTQPRWPHGSKGLGRPLRAQSTSNQVFSVCRTAAATKELPPTPSPETYITLTVNLLAEKSFDKVRF